MTALLVLLNGLSTGVRETMIDTATTLSTGHVNVGGFFKVTAGQASPVVTDYKKVLAVAQKAVPEMAFAVHRGRGWAKIVSDTGSMQLGVTASTSPASPSSRRCCTWSSGKLDDLAQPGTILIFENQAEKLGVKVGDALTISAPTTRGTNNTIDVRVVAIAQSLGPAQHLELLHADRRRCARSTSSTGLDRRRPDHADRKDLDHIPAIAGAPAQGAGDGGLPGDGGRPARVLDEVRVGHARGLDRAEAGRHQLGGRDLVHDLDAEGAARAVASC